MVKTIGMGNDAKTDGSWEQDAKVFLALEDVADAAQAVVEDFKVAEERHLPPRVLTLDTALDILDKLKKAISEAEIPVTDEPQYTEGSEGRNDEQDKD